MAESERSGVATTATVDDVSDVMVLTHAPAAPRWYRKDGESSTPGEFAAGVCSNDLFYYPIRRQGDPKDAYGYFEPAIAEGIGGGILLSMEDDYATNGIVPYGFIVWVSETTQKVYPSDQVADSYFIPDAELGLDPEIAKQLAPEIGLCAYENIQ